MRQLRHHDGQARADLAVRQLQEASRTSGYESGADRVAAIQTGASYFPFSPRGSTVSGRQRKSDDSYTPCSLRPRYIVTPLLSPIRS